MSWTNKKGFNFRSTLAYVTDGTNETCIQSDGSNNIAVGYPTSRTIDSDTFDVGWNITAVDGCRNRSASVDARLAGVTFTANSGSAQRTFRVDLPAAGTYAITLAMGDATGGSNPYWQVVDDSTVLETVDLTGSATTSAQFYDANQVKHTTAANWVSNQTAKEYTFSSTILKIVIGTPSSSTGNTMIAHLGIQATAATLEQEGFRWVQDDGDEDESTFTAAQDTSITAAAGSTKRLRVIVNATGDPATKQYKLQWRLSGGSWADVT